MSKPMEIFHKKLKIVRQINGMFFIGIAVFSEP